MGRLLGMYNPAYCRRADWMHYLEHFASFDHAAYGRMGLDLQDHDASSYLGAIRAPTLVIGGQRDTITPAYIAHDLHAQIRGAELLMLRTGSHIGHLEHAELVNLRIERFLTDRVAG